MNHEDDVALPLLIGKTFGGDYDDLALMIGFELGVVWAHLHGGACANYYDLMRVALPQVDLIAMRFNRTLEVIEVPEDEAQDDGLDRMRVSFVTHTG